MTYLFTLALLFSSLLAKAPAPDPTRARPEPCVCVGNPPVQQFPKLEEREHLIRGMKGVR